MVVENKHFRVTWEIEIEAPTAEKAARMVLGLQRSRDARSPLTLTVVELDEEMGSEKPETTVFIECNEDDEDSEQETDYNTEEEFEDPDYDEFGEDE